MQTERKKKSIIQCNMFGDDARDSIVVAVAVVVVELHVHVPVAPVIVVRA
jgi:hypothetical protein